MRSRGSAKSTVISIWRLYNEHEGCTPCGTMYRTYDVGAEARLLEQILRDAVKQRNRYKLE